MWEKWGSPLRKQQATVEERVSALLAELDQLGVRLVADTENDTLDEHGPVVPVKGFLYLPWK
jgi:hypothetical protein